ncbi:hypothetical protein PHJA_002806100 [Phtheirospermum japonicum]|uniref:Uncharacterized protein n=1 Tax=Phtheirospermum japonicum TaxID=374723 RepID=A0A830D3J1_9LAMI|nr:hypothetical protein PHJA_002806100 [Phtheirospermum japonicum]
MAFSPSSQNYTFHQCTSDFGEYYKDHTQEQLDAAVLWIGMYIAAASAACTVAMAADVVNGFRKKKLWFPCKYFSLNAFSLAVLAVAMKLPVDLTARMKGINDKLARLSSLVLMSIALSNLIASLGSMGNNEIMLNLAALGILVITVATNASIHIIQVRSHYTANITLGEKVASIVSMLLLLVIFCSTAVMVPTAKRYIESQYNQMHKRVLTTKFTTDELRVAVRRYWVMAESGSPQFVIARSVTCVASGLMCLLMALTLLEAHIRLPLVYRGFRQTASNYKWSTNWTLFIQSIGVALGTIAPLLRWFTAAKFKSTKIGRKSFEEEFKVEAYWTQSLKNWRDSPLPLKSRHLKFRKILHDAKRLFLNIGIGVQISIVRASKLVLLVSAVFVKGLMFCFSKESSDNSIGCESRAGMDIDFSPYVLRLEGETELPKRTLANICTEVDELIRMGKNKQSKNLIKLLQKSVNFNGVRDFDSSEVKSLHSQSEPPNCWSLPVVTLTSIAISLPNITDQKSDQVLSAVRKGVYFVKLIEETLDPKGELESIRNAADVAWVRVELYREWQGKDLNSAGRTHKETLQNLSDIAEKTIKRFTADTNNILVQDPHNWPVKVIAANSMYRITQTILSGYGDDHPLTDEDMFERLSTMISDILAACLTNLARVISLKCHSNAIKEREKSIRQAALLLGESEEILEILEPRELPNLDPEKVISIEGWRAFMEQGHFHKQNGGHASTELER